MSKFKVGDKVRVVNEGSFYDRIRDKIYTIENTKYGHVHPYTFKENLPSSFAGCWRAEELQLIKGEQTMGHRTFRLLKETPELKKGAVLQEACDDGDQGFEVLDGANFKYGPISDGEHYARDCVLGEPKWFEEVFPLVPEYGNKAELEAFKKFAKRRK